MRKYNMNQSDSKACGCDGASLPYSTRFGQHPIPFFDIPCLYYPQYSCEWSNSRCSYGIYGLSAPETEENSLLFHTQVQEGRYVHAGSESIQIDLEPGKLYLFSYQVTADVSQRLGVIPVVDCISDLCNACYSSGNSGKQSVSSTFLLPVVESASSVHLLLDSDSSDNLSGCVSVVALADL